MQGVHKDSRVDEDLARFKVLLVTQGNLLRRFGFMANGPKVIDKLRKAADENLDERRARVQRDLEGARDRVLLEIRTEFGRLDEEKAQLEELRASLARERDELERLRSSPVPASVVPAPQVATGEAEAVSALRARFAELSARLEEAAQAERKAEREAHEQRLKEADALCYEALELIAKLEETQKAVENSTAEAQPLASQELLGDLVALLKKHGISVAPNPKAVSVEATSPTTKAVVVDVKPEVQAVEVLVHNLAERIQRARDERPQYAS